MTSNSSDLRGIILMAVAMLGVPMVDGIAKYLSADYSPLFIGWARYAVASLIVIPLAYRYHGMRMFRRSSGSRIWCAPRFW
ncbi:hypothetical protein [uncultured Sulfitobacter sp.]|uniref:hypothetical protein n=1 Tax=uncultured Sulfitobacter sp. TaxID=191468 RepID=UPI00260312A5|nr:hypothetical protein [uncultured Sulfitobacter sp.]